MTLRTVLFIGCLLQACIVNAAFSESQEKYHVRVFAGVDAPVLDGEKLSSPVVVELLGRIDGDRCLKIQGGMGRFVASAVAKTDKSSSASHRVFFEIVELETKLPDGSRFKQRVMGWTLDETGVRGIRGSRVGSLPKSGLTRSSEHTGMVDFVRVLPGSEAIAALATPLDLELLKIDFGKAYDCSAIGIKGSMPEE